MSFLLPVFGTLSHSIAVNCAAGAASDAPGVQQSSAHTSPATPDSCCKSLDYRRSHSACTPRL